MIATTLQVIGLVFVLCVLVGALVPGMNFHVILAGDESAVQSHQRMVQRIKHRAATGVAK